ncbi:hypothetical protein XELAEV_18022473mg [Xenopus laevis]|uniref:Uncharacterized protein n=1 Tax=Xenopus laevis TaxID=8355 RepID=A0A974D4A1_XENLA|nr:hypothetical protein XELAEV_18022473mg [Xenopus laevis]
MSLPDLQQYYLAAQLSQMWTLKYADPGEAVYQLWQEILQTELPPFHALAIVEPKKDPNNSLLLLQRCIITRVQFLIDPKGLDLLTSLWRNAKLAPLARIRAPKAWLDAGIFSLDQVWNEQVRWAVRKALKPCNFHLPPTRVAEEFMQDQPHHKISSFYKALQSTILLKTPLKVRERWEADISPITDEQWNQVLQTPLLISPIYKFRILQLYFVHSAYYSRKLEEGTILHTFWSWSKIKPFSIAIQSRIRKMLGFEIPLDPKYYLLVMDPPTTLTLPAQIMLIAQNWKATDPPAYSAWVIMVQELQKMEDLIARRKGSTKSNMSIWQLWILENI